MAKYVSGPYGEILATTARSKTKLIETEQEKLGTTHASVGGYLAQWWHLPPKIVDAVRYHHDPDKAQTDPVLTHLTHLANALAHRLELSTSGPIGELEIAPETCNVIGLRPEALAKIEDALRNTELMPN